MNLKASQTKYLRWTLRVCFLLPLAYWFYQGVTGGLGVQPLVTLNRQTGYVVLFLIIANLWEGVLIHFKWLGPSWIRWIYSERRSLGIAAGCYVILHFLCYFSKEAFETKALTQMFTKVYLLMGLGAMVVVLILMATSNDLSVRKMGIKKWKTLHRAIHAACFLILAHIFLIEKGNLPLMALMTFPLIPFQLYRLLRVVFRAVFGAALPKAKKT